MTMTKPSGPKVPQRYWGPWHFSRSRGMAREIEAIRRYIKVVTAALDREFTEFTAELGQVAESANEQHADTIGDDFEEAQTLYVEHFPAFTIQNTFVATYSLLEDNLFGIARFVGSRLDIELDPSELADKGINAARKFLKKLCGVEIPADEFWNAALKHGQIRNVCAHAGRKVKKENNEIRDYVARTSSLSINKEGEIVLTQEFCFEVLDNVENLLKAAYQLGWDRIAHVGPKKK
jgi:hypothetical protein